MPIQWILGILSTGVKWSEHDDDSTPVYTEGKNVWIFTTLPLWHFI
jgi:hypothetical protein